jgi:hypothetical protein
MEEGGGVMRDIRISLRIKYKIGHVPDDHEAERWAERTQELIEEGLHPEEAGRQAASEVFPDFDSVILKAEADTIAALLEAARRK